MTTEEERIIRQKTIEAVAKAAETVADANDYGAENSDGPTKVAHRKICTAFRFLAENLRAQSK